MQNDNRNNLMGDDMMNKLNVNFAVGLNQQWKPSVILNKGYLTIHK
jgi:hypothetical protein